MAECIRAFSRPGGALTKIAGPIGQWVQDRLTNRYLSAAERIAHDQPPGRPSTQASNLPPSSASMPPRASGEVMICW
jgi:hypothetical protein